MWYIDRSLTPPSHANFLIIFPPHRAELRLEGTLALTTQPQPNDDAVSVSSDSFSDDSDEELLARARKRRKFDQSTVTYNGVQALQPTKGRKTVLVTGGAGFIGSHTAGELGYWGEREKATQQIRELIIR